MPDIISFLDVWNWNQSKKNKFIHTIRTEKKKKRALKAASKFLLFLFIVETSKKIAFKSA